MPLVIKTDLPIEDQKELARISAIPVALRSTRETAFLSARASYLTNRGVELPVKDGTIVRTSADRIEGAGYGQVKVTTNGTTPIHIFGIEGAPCALTITGIVIVSKDVTAGNIIVKHGASVVSTTVKGIVADVFVNGGAISNNVYAKADVATIESSSVGNADVYITFTIA